MEWNGERAGDLALLRLLPRDKTGVLGLMTAMSGALESKDTLARRSTRPPAHPSAASPTPTTATPSPSTSNGKLERVVEVAHLGWGRK